MIIGDITRFAIESRITQAYVEMGARALGLFVIHAGGLRYGVYSPTSSLLACSFDEIEDRIANRGRHVAPFAKATAVEIVTAFLNAFYADNPTGTFLGLAADEFRRLFVSNHLQWAPDGDEAFDDGSFVLQFDVDDSVRVIAFKVIERCRFDSSSVRDQWLPAGEFYEVLRRWRDSFQADWERSDKASSTEPT